MTLRPYQQALLDSLGTLTEPGMPESHRKVLAVLRASDKPMLHREVVRAITEPWYEKPSSFKASVSSCLGVLRSHGLIRCHEREIPLGYNGRHSYKRIERRWYAVPKTFHSGGVISARLPVADEYLGLPAVLRSQPFHMQQPSRVHRPGRNNLATYTETVVLNINGAEPRWRPPATPNTVQMLDDIDRIEETPATRHNRRMGEMQRRMADTFERDFDQRFARAIRG